MNVLSIALIASVTATTAASALYAGGVAYPDNWSGGPPLGPIGQQGFSQTGVTYVQPGYGYQQPQYTYVQPTYGYQPQVTYVQPQVAYVQPQVAYVQPQVAYVQPQVTYGNGAYSTRLYDPYYSPEQQSGARSVQGPASSRCIISTLNGTQNQNGCFGTVNINRADYPYLRQKFSRYQPNSGYALNIPSDFDLQR